ncbi:MAG: FmdB family zinc ribbon protein [Thermoguttaceae bacterium]|jgi:putative FmdB family regulatory protein
MPIYEYTCDDCGHEFELLIFGSQRPSCPACAGEHLTKAMSVPAAHTGSAREPSCPARGECDVPHCPGGGCGMAQWR